MALNRLPGFAFILDFEGPVLSRGSFFIADVGDRPLATWRGILKARGCLLQGLHMRIRNGLNTSIWGDYWLPAPSSGKVITTRQSHTVFLDKVADLIDWSTYSWNYDLITSTFWPVDVHHVLQVPIRSPDTMDRLVWAFSKSGVFTVRSCYHNLIDGTIDVEGGSTSHHGDLSVQWDWL